MKLPPIAVAEILNTIKGFNMIIIQNGHDQGGEPQKYELTIQKVYLNEEKELTIEVSEE